MIDDIIVVGDVRVAVVLLNIVFPVLSVSVPVDDFPSVLCTFFSRRLNSEIGRRQVRCRVHEKVQHSCIMTIPHHAVIQDKQFERTRQQQKKAKMRRINRTTTVTTGVFLAGWMAMVAPGTFITTFIVTISSFTLTPPYYNRYFNRMHPQQNVYITHRLRVSDNTEPSTSTSTRTSETEDDDTLLLESVTLDQLKKLCDQCCVSYNDIIDDETNNASLHDDDHDATATSSLFHMKLRLLQRLRSHANSQAEQERQRHLARKIKVESHVNRFDDFSNSFNESTYNPKERYEIIDTNGDDDAADNDSDEGYFFFDLPTMSDDLKQAQLKSNSLQQKQNIGTASKVSTVLSSDQVTAPPPPIEPNANGERVVKIYSTTQLNDLTSIAAAQPGHSSLSLDSMQQRTDGDPQPWDFADQQQPYTSSSSSNNQHPYIEQAKEQLFELISTLLATSGMSGFATNDGFLDIIDDDDGDDDDEDDIRESTRSSRNIKTQKPAVGQGGGFDPVNVPVELLTSSSKAIRACRGELLDEVLREFELRAIGYDGKAGDDLSGGGGHYREAIKVRAFLEGYRRAEVRRLARETSSMLLNKLMIEGIDALDLTLNTMTRSNDDTEEYGGTQLNDSLLDFLSDMIRQKEREVEAMNGDRSLDEEISAVQTWADTLAQDDDDDLDQYWNVTEVDGQRIETFDPNSEQVKNVIQAKLDKIRQQNSSPSKNTIDIPETGPAKVLLLLKLLRERIKAEAAFAYDEKGRNLRLLAYCLRADTDDECEQYMLKQLGNSLDVRFSCWLLVVYALLPILSLLIKSIVSIFCA